MIWLIANLIKLFFVDRLINIRGEIIGFVALSDISNFLFIILQRIDNQSGTIQLILELVAYFSVCSSFNMEMIYTIELFPTCFRNSAIAMARQALVLAGVLSPIMVAAGRTNGVWSLGVFGIAMWIMVVWSLLIELLHSRCQKLEAALFCVIQCKKRKTLRLSLIW